MEYKNGSINPILNKNLEQESLGALPNRIIAFVQANKNANIDGEEV